ncbi:hypothetical protein EVAR_39045_1 [Eumeta japonica]|uniref:Uncharacterized protein n=1 Tax=Eumeta variegata TaxID=151549 RepID=A0A4C1WNM1_EUMVA|nr:hypothetical protein EVAR_39045_1 [Eumeta japonica]
MDNINKRQICEWLYEESEEEENVNEENSEDIYDAPSQHSSHDRASEQRCDDANERLMTINKRVRDAVWRQGLVCVLGFIQIGTVTNSGIGIESRTESRFENGTRIRIESWTGIEIENGIENNSWGGVRTKIATEIEIKSKTRIEIDIDQYKKKRNLFYARADGDEDINFMGKPSTRNGRTSETRDKPSYEAPVPRARGLRPAAGSRAVAPP